MARRSVTVIASDGKRGNISWYDGATEGAVLQCARLALGVTAKGNADLLWKSGDIVDFDKPITDGATLYLETTVAAAHSDGIVVTGMFSASPSSDLVRSGGAGGLSQRRVHPLHRDHGSTESMESEGGRPLDVAASSLLERCLQRTLGDSSTERSSEEERKPLMSSRWGAPKHRKLQEWGPGESASRAQRRTILRMKRLNAHLANERTYLAWVRAMQKMLAAGGVSISLSSKGGRYGTCFLILGLTYIALCPLIVLVGGRRYHKMEVAMEGSVYDSYEFFSGRDAYLTNFVMCVLAILTLGVITTEILARV